MYINN